MSEGPAPIGYAGGVEARSAWAESPAPGDADRDLAPARGGIESRNWPGSADRHNDRERAAWCLGFLRRWPNLKPS
jgi:hypothetical protein